jgi:FKBP-type peptidyl-prolyl cis-trans isomerase
MKSIRILYIFIAASMLLFSCKNDAAKQEKELLQSYLNTNNIDADPRKSGLYYLESGFSGIESIDAQKPQKGDTVIVSYKGYLLADTSAVFDQRSINEPLHYAFKEADAIAGWEEGISLMRKGITAQFIIPSELAYGKQQTGIIPPYSTLIFDVRVIEIKE